METIEFTEEDIKLAETLAGYGLTVQQIAGAIGVSKKTFERRVAENSILKDALERGRCRAASIVTGHLFKLASTGKNIGATIFWIKCRLGWREEEILEKDRPQQYVQPDSLRLIKKTNE